MGVVSQPAAALPVQTNFFWNLAGNGASSGAQWAFVVLLARLGDVAMVGQYTMGLAVAAPIFTLASLNLRALQATDVHQQFSLLDYMSVRLVTSAGAFAVTALVALSASYSGDTAQVMLLVALTKVLDSISDIVYGRLQQRERMDRIAKSMILRAGASLMTLAFLLSRQLGAVRSIAGVALSSAAVLFFYDLSSLPSRSFSHTRISVPWRKTAALFRLAGPLGFFLMLVSLNGYLSRYWLAHYRSEREVGIFSAMAFLTLAANMAVLALGQASIPAMARAFLCRDTTAFLQRATRLWLLGGILGACGIVVAHFWGAALLRLCYGPVWEEHSTIFLWLMVGSAFSYLASCTGITLTSARQFNIQLLLLLIVTVIISIGCHMLIPSQGLQGAAIAQLVGYLVQFVLSAMFVARLLWQFRRQ